MTKRPRRNSKRSRKPTMYCRMTRSERFLTALDITTTTWIPTRRSVPVRLPGAVGERPGLIFRGLIFRPDRRPVADPASATYFPICLAEAEPDRDANPSRPVLYRKKDETLR